MIIVSKFGGSVTSNVEGIKRAMEIVKSDPSRRYVIASAPGAVSGDPGITDLLFMCHSASARGEDCNELIAKISECYRNIADGLGTDFDVDGEIAGLKKDLASGRSLDYIGSRGEYIMGKILAEYLGWEFVDPSELIFFNSDGTLNAAKTFSTAKAKLGLLNNAVIPGFYGSMPDGSIKTFPRGDGDSSGAIVARSVNADLFEKWSETAKTYSADPSVIPNPQVIRHITYEEAVELNYVGINAIRDSVIFMLKEAGIPLKICSIIDGGEAGMMISAELPEGVSRNDAVCITGRRNYYIIHINKYGLNKIYGFGEKLFGLFSKYCVPCEHCLSGIHKISVVVKSQMFILHHRQLLEELKRVIEPDSITVENNLSLIAVIGHGMKNVPGTFESLFYPLAKEKINVRMIDEGADDLNIIIGVSDSDYNKAVQTLYDYVILKKEK